MASSSFVSPTDAPIVDVLDVSDLRFAGGTAHSIAEEIKAQHTAGYRTGLLHLNGPLVAKVAPVNPQIRREVEHGHAELFVRPDRISATAVVIRHPAVLQEAADQLPRVDAEHVVIVANAAPHDIDGHEHYRPEHVHRLARRHFGREPLWAPIGPLVRDSIAARVPASSLLNTDWVNIIDVDAWAVDRPTWQGIRPVIGRHSRASAQKWPRDAETLRAAYPADGSCTVRVLGGADPAEALLGKLPDSWEVYEFGAMPPREFLAELDFFVYYHDPQWIEAFGRTILEALASGVPAILPPHFEPLFGEAAVYAEPRDVRRVIAELYRDRDAYQDQVRKASALVRERFGHEAHAARLATLLGKPSAAEPPAAAPVRPSPAETVLGSPAQPTRRTESTTPRPRVLFVSSNGSGMGHLTRLLAYATRVDDEVEPHFLSLSQAVPLVETFGYAYEYLPSMDATGLAPPRWHAYFAECVSHTVERLRPATVVFDGTWPYEGIPVVREAFPEITWVWSRRGMWKAGIGADRLDKAAWFDMVIEPGDLAAPLDRGPTVNAPAERVGPVSLLDVDGLAGRTAARAALGLAPDVPMALVSLGAGNINDTSGDMGAAVAVLRDLGVEVCVTRPDITAGGEIPADVHVVRTYPLSRYVRAFDLAVSASGYNSFHELLRFGVPTLFVPNRSTALDDQVARARFAAEHGLAHQLATVSVDAARPLLADLLDNGADMVARVRALDPGNGATDAGEHIARLAHASS